MFLLGDCSSHKVSIVTIKVIHYVQVILVFFFSKLTAVISEEDAVKRAFFLC